MERSKGGENESCWRRGPVAGDGTTDSESGGCTFGRQENTNSGFDEGTFLTLYQALVPQPP